MTYWVYMMASGRNGTLYVGVTNSLARRAWEHRTKALDGFSAQYDVVRRVWYEPYADIRDAITREKALKKWRRAWKLKLIEDMNPEWDDLYLQLNM